MKNAAIRLFRRKRWIIPCVLTCCIVISVAVFSYSQSARAAVSDLYKDPDFVALTQSIESSKGSENVDASVFEDFARRLQDAKPSVIDALIDRNIENATMVRTIIAAAEYNQIELPSGTVKRVLCEPGLSSDVRIDVLLLAAKKGDLYENEIAEQVYDDEIGNFAFRELYVIAPARALQAADRVMKAYDGTYSLPLQGALYVRASSLKKNAETSEVTSFITFCEKVMEQLPDDADQKGLLLAYISRIDSPVVLSYLIDNGLYREMLPLLAVYQSDTIIGILQNSQDVDQIEIAIRAIEASGDGMFYQPLNEHLEKNPEFYRKHTDLKQLVEAAIEKMTETQSFYEKQELLYEED